MIQISIPTQAPGESNAAAESAFRADARPGESVSGDSGNVFSSGVKKDKAGLFAKLLDGLAAKKSAGKSSPDHDREVQGQGNFELAAGNDILEPFINLQKPQISELLAENSGEYGDEPAFSVSFLQNLPNKSEDSGIISLAAMNSGADEVEFTPQNAFDSGETRLGQGFFENSEESGGSDFIYAASFEGESPENPALTAAGRQRSTRAGDFSAAGETPDQAARGIEPLEISARNTVDPSLAEGANPEFRGTEGRRERFRLDVRDLRHGRDGVNSAGRASDGPAPAGFSASAQAGGEIEISVDLRSGETGAAGGRRGGESPALSFEDALARELRGNLSQNIVRDAALIIRDGGEGTIRLSLRPESLGNVKIRLEMAENKITGHIIVESTEAFRAFERELPVLEKAFRDSGFGETNLEMFLGQDGGNYPAGEQRQDREYPGLLPVLAASLYEAGSAESVSIESAPSAVESIFYGEQGRKPVNLLV